VVGFIQTDLVLVKLKENAAGLKKAAINLSSEPTSYEGRVIVLKATKEAKALIR